MKPEAPSWKPTSVKKRIQRRFHKFKLGVKLFGGYSLPLGITLLVAYISFTTLGALSHLMEKTDHLNRIVKEFKEIQMLEKEFTLTGKAASRKKMNQMIHGILNEAENAKKDCDHETDIKQLELVISTVAAYRDSFRDFAALQMRKKERLNHMGGLSDKMMEYARIISGLQKKRMKDSSKDFMKYNSITKFEFTTFVKRKLSRADDANLIILTFLEIRNMENEYILANGPENLKKRTEEKIGAIFEICDKFEARVKENKSLEEIGRIRSTLKEYQSAFEECGKIMGKQKTVGAQMEKFALEADTACGEALGEQKRLMDEKMKNSQNIVIVATSVAMALGIILSWIIGRNISIPLKKVIKGMDMASQKVLWAAGNVSTASQEVARGSSEQAAAIEETSSSLEEMAAMTRQNAKNAKKAESDMSNARETMDKMQFHMDDMARAVDEITRTSDESRKIIKSIDEIAFQTNLLSLNASIEAARAGDAGQGFAVVAGEVRRLALGAAEAAKETSRLIEETVQSVKSINELTPLTRKAMDENVQISGKMGELIDEISAASDEQARGVEYINRSVSNMDQVTQQNAATAEEFAGSSETMYDQTENMKRMISDLFTLLGGKNHQPKEEKKKTDAQLPAPTTPKAIGLDSHGETLPLITRKIII